MESTVEPTTVTLPRYERPALPLSRLLQWDWALVLFGLFVLFGILTRFWDLGSRALHHDESLHAVYSWYLYVGNGSGYKHDPLMHGPWLFHITAFIFWLFGDTDFTVRVSSVLFGLGVLVFPWFLRRWIGTRGMLATTFLTLISPSFLYYSRFIREDIFCALWQALIVWMMFRYLEDGRKFHLYGTATFLALFYSNKESAFLFSAVIWGFLLLLFLFRWRRGQERDLQQSRTWDLLLMIGTLLLPLTSAVWIEFVFGQALGWGWDALDYSWLGIWRSGSIVIAMFGLAVIVAAIFWDLRTFAFAAMAFYLPYTLLHTTFLTNGYGLASGLVGALGYWLDQHDVQRGEQPLYYYLLLVPLYELLPLLVSLFGGGYLLLKRRQGPSETEDGQPNVPALFPVFLVWWFLTILVILSIAGEKMPWLILNMSLPLIWLAGWALGHFFDQLDEETLRERGGLWFGLTVGAMILAVANLLWLALTSQYPFGGTELDALNVTSRWVGGLAVLVGGGWLARRLAAPLGGFAARQSAALVALSLLSLVTIRYAWMASYTHGDIARDMLIYTQTTPDVTMAMAEITRLSERLEGGLEMKVAYDNVTSWPFEWYLRNFKNKIFFGGSPGPNISEAPVVLTGLENENSVRPFVQGYVRRQYKLRWWFPEDYKMFKDNPSLAFQYLGDPAMRKDLMEILLNRDLKQPLGSTDFVMYVRPDVLQEVWQFGSRIQATDPDLLRDEYAEKASKLTATTSFGQGGQVSLNSPKAVAIAPNGNLVIADGVNHRIVVVDAQGNQVSSFGSFCNLADNAGCQGNGAGQFNEPWGVGVGPDGSIYVSDTWNHRIQKFDADGKFVTMWGTFADTGGALGAEATFWGPRGLAVDPDGNVYVADTGNKRIEKFDADGKFLAHYGGVGGAPGQFNEPVGVAVAPDGTIFVADTWNRRIQSFDKEFKPLAQWSVRAWAGQSVNNKPYIAADNEHVWISDPENFRVVEFTRDGQLSRVWGAFGSDASSLNLPLGVAADAQGNLYVADSVNNRVQRFSAK
jgi:uncharacterized protein (TIGR03663 family)